MAYATRTHYAPGDLVTSADYNQGMDNEDWLKGNCDQLIAASVLGADAAAISFTSIPATFRNLLLRLYVRGDKVNTQQAVNCQFNGDTGANYDWESAYITTGASPLVSGDGVAATYIQLDTMPAANAPANSFGQFVYDIIGYSNSANHKTIRSNGFERIANSSGNILMRLSAGDWRSATAINRVDIITEGAQKFKAASFAALYGSM